MEQFYTTSEKKLTITPIKHGSLEIDFNGFIIEVDPVTQYVKPETDYTLRPKADLILITHEHRDHLDSIAVEEVSKESTMVITNANCARLLGKGTVLHHGESLQLNEDISIRAVPAYNLTPERQDLHPRGRDNGYIIELDHTRIYIASDTELIPEMGELGPVDIAFLPCNQPYTMTPAQLRKAADLIKPAVLFPYHFSKTPVHEIEKAMEGSCIDVRIRNFQ
ncbi:MAG: MBL fold metallo-hydrolase [Paraprevotella sp.]|nr:MBL fold metallo-hydrolase [Paraprevotella sp.]